MRTFTAIACLLALSCGGTQKAPESRTVGYDPELYETCLVEVVSEAEPVCVRDRDDLGMTVWRYPLGETENLSKMRKMRASTSSAVARHLAVQLIKRPESYRCSGSEEACARMRRQIACEAEVARAELVDMLTEDGKALEAFRYVGAIVQTGQAHYRYEDAPDQLGRLRPHLPQGVVDTCLTQYEPPMHINSGKPHWKPYTEKDPAPKW